MNCLIIIDSIFTGEDQGSRIRWTVMFVTSELFVIASALGYAFFLFPIYTQLSSDIYRGLWRFFLHPIWFELTMLLPQRVIALKEIPNGQTAFRIVPVMHSLFHNATMGWMLVNTIRDTYTMITVTLLSNLQELVLRSTAYKRDAIALRFLYKQSPTQICSLYASLLNIQIILEIVAIIISPIIMLAFRDYTFIFSWYSASNSSGFAMIIQITVFQLFCEFVTDIICILIESKFFNIQEAWIEIRSKKFIIFIIYGFCSMGVFGVIYTCMRLPRAVYCFSETDYCSCSYDRQSVCVT